MSGFKLFSFQVKIRSNFYIYLYLHQKFDAIIFNPNLVSGRNLLNSTNSLFRYSFISCY